MNAARSGFTLLEMIIAVTILALVFSISVPALNSITRVELRAAADKLAGNVKYLYDRAVLEKIYVRLVFDLDTGTYYPESTADRFYLKKDPLEVENGAVVNSEGTEGTDGTEEEDTEPDIFDRLFGDDMTSAQSQSTSTEGDQIQNKTWAGWSDYAAKFKRKKAHFGGYETELSKRENLPEGTAFYKMQTRGLKEPATVGKVYMHIFPTGYVEEAVIYLVDKDDLELPEDEMKIWTLKVDPLTGIVRVYDEKIDLPERIYDEDSF